MHLKKNRYSVKWVCTLYIHVYVHANVFYLLSIFLWCSQSGDRPLEDLAKKIYKLNMKVKDLKHICYIFDNLREPFIKNWQIFKKIVQIQAVENLKI